MTANISFFIPAYNCSATIAESVESIMKTNFKIGDELIIVDDCSTDDTAIKLSALRDKYPDIQIITHKRNKGGAAARNTAVENASNHLLFCLDSDNVLEKESITPLQNFLVEHDADVACFQEFKYFSATTATIDESWLLKPGIFSITDLLSGSLSPGASGNYLFTKKSWLKVNGYTEDLGSLDTWSFGFKQLIENCKTVVMPGGYYFHRRGHASYYLTDAWSKRKSVSLRLIKLIINYIDRIHPADVDYIFSKKGRYTWFDNLQKRPIRLVEGSKAEKIWEDHSFDEGTAKKIRQKIAYYKARLARLLN